MSSLIRTIVRANTSTFIVAALCAAVLSGACKFLTRFVPYSAYAVSSFFEFVCIGFFIASYTLLWLLLVIGLFRPYNEFTLHSARARRAINFFSALGLLLLLHVWVAFALGTAGS